MRFCICGQFFKRSFSISDSKSWWRVTTQVTLEHIQAARIAKDPQVVQLLLDIVHATSDPTAPPPPENVYTFQRFLGEINNWSFYKQQRDQQAQQRIEKIKLVEANEDIEPRFKSHELIYDLWASGDPFERECLLRFIRSARLVYGPWKALKRIYKEAEQANDTQVMGALSARFDTALSTNNHAVSNRTLAYLCRRSWRYLRRVAETLPACYTDTVVDFVVPYTNYGSLGSSWVYNQIFKHSKNLRKRSRYRYSQHRPNEFIKTRGFPELWKRSPLPLFSILQSAQRDDVLRYAVAALKTDFRTVLREIEPRWVRQLINNDKTVVHEFVVWILENVSRFEQSKFRELDLHDSVLQLLDSQSPAARALAAKYARVHARDIPVDRLIRLANSEDEKVRELASDLLRSHDPRTEVGLDAWGKLLDTGYGNAMAIDFLRKHFTADDLTPAWFKERLLSGRAKSGDFARERLLEVHSAKKLGTEYFYEVYNDASPRLHGRTISFALQELSKTELNETPIDWLEQILVRHGRWVANWVAQGLLNPNRFDAEFLKGISFHPTYDGRPEVETARNSEHVELAQYSEENAQWIFGWLSDIRQFTPDQIGFEWLMQLVQHDEPHYHEFAMELMIKSYLPADFATESTDKADQKSESDEINIDFESATFVFTGKLATMTRAEAQKKVTAANGKNSGTVGKTLGYLVIGDEGSPMYGMGRKGSKQVKAESLNEGGAEIRIISETAFLQMLTGTQRQFSADAVMSGCETLWSMLLDNKEGTPLARFAIKYIRHHHPEICLAETDRPVDPGAEIPDEFLTFENVKPLLTDKRESVRSLGLELCQFEFARMAPPASELLELSQVPYAEVRKFVAESMTAEPTPQNRRWRLEPDGFSAEEVYQFCQSRNGETRRLGMKLIDAHPRMREPEKLFALTESPDRNVRAFVVRSFWSLYRDRKITDNWQPTEPPISALKKKRPDPENPRFGVGAPARPASHPAASDRMQFLLRRMLFEISPGRPPLVKGTEIDELKIKPLPTRKGKMLLIETIRDMAVDDHEFAAVVLPVLEEFLESSGMSEHAACLVAVTRIRKSLGLELQPAGIEVVSAHGEEQS